MKLTDELFEKARLVHQEVPGNKLRAALDVVLADVPEPDERYELLLQEYTGADADRRSLSARVRELETAVQNADRTVLADLEIRASERGREWACPSRVGAVSWRMAKITLTTELIDELCEALDFPLTLDDACRYVGVPPKVVKGWLGAAENENANDLCVELSKRVAKIMARGKRGEVMSLLMMQAAASPQTAQFLAERLIPSMALKREVKVDATVTPVRPIDLSKCTAEELEVLERAEQIRALAAGGDGQ